MKPVFRRLLRISLWLTGAVTCGFVAGLAWEDSQRGVAPLVVVVGSPDTQVGAGRDPTLARGVTLLVSNRAAWPVSLEIRCRIDTERRTMDTVWMQPTGPVWIHSGDSIHCTLPPGPERDDASVTLYWTPFLHACVGRCLGIGALGEHASEPFDLRSP